MTATSTATATSWRMAWLGRVQEMQQAYRAAGRDGDARNLGRLAVALEGRANDSGRVAASNSSLRRGHLGATAFRASINNLNSAGLLDLIGVDALGQRTYQLNTTIDTTEATARDPHQRG